MGSDYLILMIVNLYFRTLEQAEVSVAQYSKIEGSVERDHLPEYCYRTKLKEETEECEAKQRGREKSKGGVYNRR